MSCITHSGYGYSKKLCESVTFWYVNSFFPRHKLYIEIVHRGLKREGVYGYCDVIGEGSRPRHFLIELQSHMDVNLYTKTLLHELTHMKQWIVGYLKFKNGKLCFCKKPVENWEYWYQPHEVEARAEEVRLFNWYITDTSHVPVQEVSQGFVNRLCSHS